MVKKKKGICRRKSYRKSGNYRPLREDFEIFAKGVQRLEELRGELNSLNTRGYEEEYASIKAKLKNVSYIPEIEEEMRILKAKISGKHKRKEKNDCISESHKKIAKKIEGLEKEIRKKRRIAGIAEISKISELESQIKSKRRLDDKQSLEISKLDGHIKYLKEVLRKQQEEEERKKELLKKIDPDINLLMNNKFDMTLNEVKAELSKKLKARETAIQGQLQEDLEARKKNFELQYKILEDKFEKRYNDQIRKQLANEIRNKFNGALKKKAEFLRTKLEKESAEKLRAKQDELDLKEKQKLKKLENSKSRIKKKLIGILREKEEKLRKRLSEEAEKQLSEDKKSLEKKQEEVLSEINGKKKELKEKEKSILTNLIKEHERLKSKIRGEKEKELREKQKELKVKLSRKQLSELREKLQKDFYSNKNNLEKEYKARLILEKNKLKQQAHEEILVHRTRLNNWLHEHLTQEVKKLHEEHEAKKKEEKRRIEAKIKRLEQEKGFLDRIKNQLNIEARKIRENKEAYKQELMGKLEKEKQEAIKKAVAEQSSIIKNKLKKEFDGKLKLELKSKAADFEKKKADFALEVQQKTKELFS